MIVKHHHHVLECDLDEVETFNAESFEVASFLLGDLLRSGDSGEDDLFLTMAPKLAGTSGGLLSECLNESPLVETFWIEDRVGSMRGSGALPSMSTESLEISESFDMTGDLINASGENISASNLSRSCLT